MLIAPLAAIFAVSKSNKMPQKNKSGLVPSEIIKILLIILGGILFLMAIKMMIDEIVAV